MAKNKVVAHLACKECKERNYSNMVSKKHTIGTLELKKYCPRCRKHMEHKETK